MRKRSISDGGKLPAASPFTRRAQTLAAIGSVAWFSGLNRRRLAHLHGVEIIYGKTCSKPKMRHLQTA